MTRVVQLRILRGGAGCQSTPWAKPRRPITPIRFTAVPALLVATHEAAGQVKRDAQAQMDQHVRAATERRWFSDAVTIV